MAPSLKTEPLFFVESLIHPNKFRSIQAVSQRGASYDLPCAAQVQNKNEKRSIVRGRQHHWAFPSLLSCPRQEDGNIPKILTCPNP